MNDKSTQPCAGITMRQFSSPRVATLRAFTALHFWVTLLAVFIGFRSPAQAQDNTTAPAGSDLGSASNRRAAIFIKNNSGAQFDEKLGAFEDLVVGEISDLGFLVTSPDNTIKSLKSFLGASPDRTIAGSQMDDVLENNTSALRLAQNMGVDYLVVVSITTFGKDMQRLNRPDLGIDRSVTDHKMRATYKILDGSTGESISAGTILATKRSQEGDGHSESSDTVNDLLADAAQQIAGKLKARGGAAALREVSKSPDMVSFVISCSMQDLSVPEVVKDKDGNYVLTGNRYNLEPLSVTVELDGVVIGTAPGEFSAMPGLHKIRLTREGFKDWERTINVRSGQNLNVALTLTDEGRAYWLEMAEFFSRLKRDERMAEADAELIRGVAQKMRQSGIRVDKKVDVKVDTKEAPAVNQMNVDQQNVAQPVWP